MQTIVLTVADIKKIVGGKAPLAGEMVPYINKIAPYFKVTTIDRMSEFLGQIAIESMFTWRTEIWGPTAQQRKYDPSSGSQVAKNLGNTQPGDGALFKGHGSIQITGRANTQAFYNYCLKMFANLNVPDFMKKPDEIGKGVWWVIAGFWFWETRKLNTLADQRNTTAITKKINGGRTHLAERKAAVDRAREILADRYGADAAKPTVNTTANTALSSLVGSIAPTGSPPAMDLPKADLVPAPAPRVPWWGRLLGVKAPVPAANRPGLRPTGDPALWDVQNLLRQKAYYTKGNLDGLDGTFTQSAVAQARKDNGLGDGGIDADFLAMLPTMPRMPVSQERASMSIVAAAKHVPELFGPAKLLGGLGLGAIGVGTADGTGMLDTVQTTVGKVNEVAGSVQTGIGYASGIVAFLVEHRTLLLVGLGIFLALKAGSIMLDAWIKVRAAFF